MLMKQNDERERKAVRVSETVKKLSQRETIYVNFTQINNQSFRMAIQNAKQREQLQS